MAPNFLGVATGSLIGREREVAEVGARLRAARLVTLVGPGGVGKTALARAAADGAESDFPLGARHVDLARIDDPDTVPDALAGQLGFQSFDALLASPADRPVLLVVDNCEHLLDAAATTIAHILGACALPTVLATSRSPLELPGESMIALAPLALPSPSDDAADCPSVRLFLQRCHDAGVTVDDRDLVPVVELCRRLDGLPLALEIAAARARTMSVADIAARLEAGVDVLDRPRFRGDPRHRSVAETIHWSVDLLSPGAAELLAQLAVFAAPFPADTARAVTGIDDARRFDAELDELVNASLVVVDTSGPTTRYRLLDTVRRIALDELRRRGRLDETADRFADHVVAETGAMLAGATTSWRPGLLGDLVASWDGVADALRWCNEHDAEPRRAHFLCAVCWAIVHQAHAEQIAVLVRRTLERWPDRSTPAGAQAAAALATAEYVTGYPQLAAELAESTLEELTKPSLPSITLRRVLGQARRALGDVDGALAALGAAAAIGHELGMTAMAMEMEVATAQVVADAGDVATAVADLARIVDGAVESGSTITENWARSTLAWVTLRVDPPAGLALAGAALGQARAADYPIGIAVNLRSCAFGHLLLGDLTAAAAAVSDLLAELLARGALSNVRVLTDVSAALAYRAGSPAWEVLAATARHLPISTMASAQYELLPLPITTATPLPRHQIFGAVRALLAELTVSRQDELHAAGAAGAAGAQPPSTVTRRGDTFEFEFRRSAVTVRLSKGLADIVQLIGADGREVHCLDLAGAAVDESSTGDLIDAEARRRYEDRIRALQADVDDAERNNDYARAYRHQVELDELIDHLAAAIGQGGRNRRAADTTERARSAVTHRIKATIRTIDKLHPTLGRHLASSVKTGTYCSYRPEQPVVWTIC